MTTLTGSWPSLLHRLSWPEVKHHPWRNAVALLAVVLGVALAFSVHLINRSALAEFSAAVRAVNGEPDFQLKGERAGFDEALYARVAAVGGVALASPVVEFDATLTAANGKPIGVHVVGIDPLVVAGVAPALLPRPDRAASRFGPLDPGAVFLNDQAIERLAAATPRTVHVQAESGAADLVLAGRVAAGGAPLAVMDIAGAQDAFGRIGLLSRIDVRLAPGADRAAVLRALALPVDVRVADTNEATDRVSNVSRAYRVNLTVLALVAMFTGAFLVFSIQSLSVAKREPQLALLGVLGLSARQRLGLVLAESVVLGAVGSALGLALGAALAAFALRLFGGDLGGGYFAGATPTLQIDAWGTAVYGVVGMAAAVVGGWLPARAAAAIVPAQALKGLSASSRAGARWPVLVLIVTGTALSFVPAVNGMPLAAYVAIACLLLGGIAAVPWAIGALLGAVRAPRQALVMLAVERARHRRDTATIAVAGVIASLALSVALTVMVASFRDAVSQWLDTVLPADLYVRAVAPSGSAEAPALPPAFVEAARHVDGVVRVEAQRVLPVLLAPIRPPVAVIARPLAEPTRSLPMVGDLAEGRPGFVDVYVSEPMVDLYGAAPGSVLTLPIPEGSRSTFVVRGVWRDYARQSGAVVIDAQAYRRISHDERVNDLALWLAPEAAAATVQGALRALAETRALDARHEKVPLQFAAAGEIRALSLRIFDRSFAVTYWLQAVAIAIGLFGVAASYSAQVLARRKEFGLLSHLGLTRGQVLRVVAAEAAVWTGVGALLGLVLGIVVSVVLVKVVNPQSFHWTMDLALPWSRLSALCVAVMVAGTATAWLAARSSAGHRLALAVKEDW